MKTHWLYSIVFFSLYYICAYVFIPFSETTYSFCFVFSLFETILWCKFIFNTSLKWILELVFKWPRGWRKQSSLGQILRQSIQKGRRKLFLLYAEGASISGTPGRRGLFPLCHYVNVIILCYFRLELSCILFFPSCAPGRLLIKPQNPHPDLSSTVTPEQESFWG